jgi:hypothetical protein
MDLSINFKNLKKIKMGKNWPKIYTIDYFGYAVYLEFKFKLNFDEEGGSKIEKKVQKKSGKKLT